MLLAILLGVVLGLGAAYLRRSELSAPVAVGIFIAVAFVLIALVGEDDVWVLAGAMLASGGVVDVVTAGSDPRVPANVARTVGGVLVVVGLALVALG